MNFFIATDNKGVDVHITFTCRTKCKVVTSIYDLESDVVFNLRHDVVDKSLSVIMKVPFSPRNMIVSVTTDIPNNLYVNIATTPIKTYNITLGQKQKEFINFAQAFTYGMSSGTITPSDAILKSSSGDFKIVLMKMILTYTGQHKGTPCQVGAKTGIIETDSLLMSNYTLAGQMALLCHEYAHFYENERNGLPASSEEGADKFGLIMFLGAGYGELEYLNAFKQTFKRVDTNQNRNREALILKYAKDIAYGNVLGKPY